MEWIETVPLEQLKSATKVVVDVNGTDVLLLWLGEGVVAMHNRCIHRDRELKPGILLKGRIVCPGHQWSFDLETGYCKERGKSQPVRGVEIRDGVIFVTSEPIEVELDDESANYRPEVSVDIF